MLAIVNFVRQRIGDPDNGSPVFQTQDIQDALDATRCDVFNEALMPLFERTQAGIIYKRHHSEHGFFETDYILLSANLTVLTPDLAEVMRDDALFTINAGSFPPVWIQYGKSYDPWRVSADLLEQMIALQAMNNINFSSQGSSFQLNQITQSRMYLVEQYRMKQRVEMVSAARHDANSVADEKRLARVGEGLMDIPFLTGP
jgi:hypothetical protein